MKFFRGYWRQLVSFTFITLGLFLSFSNKVSSQWSIYIIKEHQLEDKIRNLENSIRHNQLNYIPNKYRIKFISLKELTDGINLDQNSMVIGLLNDNRRKYYLASKPYASTEVGFISFYKNKSKQPIIGIFKPTSYYEDYLCKYEEEVKRSIGDFETKFYDNLNKLLSDLIDNKIQYLIYNKAFFSILSNQQEFTPKFTPFIVNSIPQKEDLKIFLHKEAKRSHIEFINQLIDNGNKIICMSRKKR